MLLPGSNEHLSTWHFSVLKVLAHVSVLCFVFIVPASSPMSGIKHVLNKCRSKKENEEIALQCSATMHTPILKGHCFQNTQSDSGENHPPQTSCRVAGIDSAKMDKK